ncbi:vacuolar ATPase assembly integral membrane protein [Cordyceps militaris CM01]|uniref:Vacuolar ATPase assembly integral membrane protein n=1 Tax=Cordyceps militaris (strain CM01) TaxID=983644 RepID=G3JLI5_CORMM|nr:vacuolar ATPase assembly integral membrane protein [Cordyceps militaris CM01]EGX90559.1 vacuolar ATPase assembly integral membrane protein [Cordyceps militaris CM01]
MATRRINASERTILEKDDAQNEKSDISPAVPQHVIMKLLGFTFAMIVVPIGSYFLTVHTIFKGNSSWAGGFAALLANVVLLGYIIVAMNEDDSENIKAKAKKND